MKINTIEDFNKVCHNLPLIVLIDINNRIRDWIVDGGSLEDSYIKQQFRYAEKILEACT